MEMRIEMWGVRMDTNLINIILYWMILDKLVDSFKGI